MFLLPSVAAEALPMHARLAKPAMIARVKSI
jgi:hypothetical protein